MDNLKLIAIRVGDMGSDTSSIRKSLKSNTDYYLYQGYKISDNNIIEEREPTISIYNQPKAKFDSKDKFSYNHKPNERDFNINICAIVGENGCGKSALIEIMMRIINNFACYVIGEYRSSWAAENLLYVEGVRASLYYLGVTKGGDENGQLVDQEHSYKLDVYDRRVVLYRNGIELCNFENADLKYPIEPYARGISDLLGKNYHLYKTQIPILLQDFFYTIVSNYSVYAYNTNDVLNENADRDRISIINEVTKDKFFKNQLKLIEQIKFEIESIGSNDKIDPRIKKLAKQSLESKIKILEPRLEKDRSWLMGLFHKNDGYTAPMVITPFRDRGNMDVNNESFLAKSRLISLIASGIVKDINGKSIDRVELKWYEDKCFNSFEEVFSEVGLGEVTESANIELINTYSNEILNYYVQFGAIYDKTVLNNDDTGIQYALKYLVYKTLKISRNYTIFNRLYNTLLFNTNDDTEVKKAISDLVANIKADRSHITLKIRQIFSFLLRQQYDVSSYYIKHNESIEPDKVFFNDKVKLHISNNQDIDDLLPPAIF